MEVFNKLKELSKEKFEDNFYLVIGLFFLVTYQLIRDILILFKKFMLMIHEKLKKRFGDNL